MEMNYFSLIVFFRLFYFSSAELKECGIVCPVVETKMECGLNLNNNTYKMFPNKCTFAAHAECHKVDLVQTPLKYCIKYQKQASRRVYGESCPVFCPSHYRPVCGAAKFRSYAYRSFTNGCYMDMLNCHGDEDFSNYIEVPLEFCQKHLMKNIFKEQVVVSNAVDYMDYFKK